MTKQLIFGSLLMFTFSTSFCEPITLEQSHIAVTTIMQTVAQQFHDQNQQNQNQTENLPAFPNQNRPLPYNYEVLERPAAFDSFGSTRGHMDF